MKNKNNTYLRAGIVNPRLFQKSWINYLSKIEGFYLPFKDFFILGLFRKPKELPERGLANYANENILNGFNVIQIGGGDGFTSINTLSLLNNSGKLIIYEGSYESIERIKHNLSISKFTDNNFEIIHGIVGDSIFIYGSPSVDIDIIDPLEVPDCDYMEFDCEGSEFSILEGMRIRPNYIVAEVHPLLIGLNSDWLFNWIETNSYSIDYLSDHDGQLLSLDQFIELYDFNLTTGKKRNKKLKARAPVVIGLKKKSEVSDS